MINIFNYQIWWVQDIYCLDQKNMVFDNNTQRASHKESPIAGEKPTAVNLSMKIWSKFNTLLHLKIY